LQAVLSLYGWDTNLTAEGLIDWGNSFYVGFTEASK
jgi:hypothetical protein